MTASAYLRPVLRRPPASGGLPDAARPFLFGTIALTIAAIAATATARDAHPRWTDVAVVVGCGALAQIFAAHTTTNQVFHTGVAFSVAAALLLPPQLVVVACVVQHVPEWVRLRYAWYIQCFNIANVVLSALAAWTARDLLVHAGLRVGPVATPGGVTAAACAAVVFVLVNHALLARMLRLARGHEVAATGLFAPDGLAVDLALGAVGIGVAFSLLRQWPLAPVVAVPLILIHRTIAVPALRERALRDHRTGLLDARGIDEAVRDEVERARRTAEPLTVLLCDVAGLDAVNRRHGRARGDAALVLVADVLYREVRGRGRCARLGGDDFLVVLPETSEEDALALATQVQARLRRAPLPTETGSLRVDLSVAATMLAPADRELSDAVARADAAMADAKASRGGSFLTVA